MQRDPSPFPALPPFDPAAVPRPFLVAHRGGNSRAAVRRACRAGVDWMEVDVWWHYGRIVARHDRALWRLPITYDRARIGLAPIPHLTLDELLDRVAGTPVRLLLDLKGDAPELPAALVGTLHRRDAVTRAALCGQEWAPLDAARALDPDLSVFFSLGREEHLPAYLRRLDAGAAPRLISICHTLVTPDRLSALHARGVTVLAWTVNDLATARRLVSWGVDGITSDSLSLLASLREAAAGG
jgi:glycerophosphoryl diester phosphodiesterase